MGSVEILEQADQDEEWDFGAALERIQPRLLAYARRQMAKGIGFRNAAFSSEDLTSEAIRKVLEHQNSFLTRRAEFRAQNPDAPQSDDDALFIWTRTIVKNTFLNWVQKTSADSVDAVLMDRTEDPMSSASPEWKTKQAEVMGAMAKLGPDCRNILALAGLGYTYDEMSTRLATSTGNVKSRLSRCRTKLGDLMEINPKDFLN